MGAPADVLELIERFRSNVDAYRSGQYNETQLRREFLDPFFRCLGWDVENKGGYAEAYKDVIHEDAIKIGGISKAPDYCFRVGGTRKFFVEAKKPSINLRNDVGPAFQLRRYAWSAKLPLSILTDFEEFAVYDCRIQPNQKDAASTARINYLTYDQFDERWDEIAGIFARESVLKGSFDKFAETAKAKRGTATVDRAFLKEIEHWRELLARNIALRNTISQRDLNFAVQRTIDRIVFLRICEDRGIETYGRLRDIGKGTGIYEQLGESFRLADIRYNSGIFHFQNEKNRVELRDDLTLHLALDDKPLREIIKGLYFPDSPYEFSVLPVEILGNVYEQFLGKVIRLTSGRKAVVEEKPEVKKAGGVYYTPAFVVDFMVRETLGRLLTGKTPQRAAKVRILDPACGSGSFLIGAYQYLLDWHREYYLSDAPGKHVKAIHQDPRGVWRLTTAERKRILTNCIFGVDIDSQAVEVTKLSLLLKVLEGENEQTLAKQLKLFHERALPDLGKNIKCGNSLIAPDFYTLHARPDTDYQLLVNAFDWTSEFPEIFSGGGFDVVIGNPPYVLLQDDFRDDDQLAYFRQHYKTASFKVDTYHLFIERSIRLTRSGGMVSLITPSNFMTNNHLIGLRRLLLEETQLNKLVVIDDGVFDDASVDNAIIVLSAGQTTSGTVPVPHMRRYAEKLLDVHTESFSSKIALNDSHILFTGRSDAALHKIWERLDRASTPLKNVAFVNFGKQLRDRKTFVEDVVEVDNLAAIKSNYRPCYTGRDIGRYVLKWQGLACLNDRVAQRGGCWDDDRQDGENKLLTRQIGAHPAFALDEVGHQCLNTIFMVNAKNDLADPKYLLAILNSKVIRAYWLDKFYDRRRTFPKIKGTYLEMLPIPAADEASHDRLIDAVDTMIALQVKVGRAKTDHEKTVMMRQIEVTDRQIDEMVFSLFKLSGNDIKQIERSASGADKSSPPDA